MLLKKRGSPQKPDLPRLDMEFSSLHNCEKINFCHLNHSIRAIFITAASPDNTTRVFTKGKLGWGVGTPLVVQKAKQHALSADGLPTWSGN